MRHRHRHRHRLQFGLQDGDDGGLLLSPIQNLLDEQHDVDMGDLGDFNPECGARFCFVFVEPECGARNNSFGLLLRRDNPWLCSIFRAVTHNTTPVRYAFEDDGDGVTHAFEESQESQEHESGQEDRSYDAKIKGGARFYVF